MSTENGYNPAMPSSVSGTADGGIVSSRDFEGYEGISKREYFAGLGGILKRSTVAECQALTPNPKVRRRS